MESVKKTFRITGGKRLAGTASIHGNKNSALPCMVAAVLLSRVGQTLRLTNVPRIRDTHVLADILNTLGITAFWRRSDELHLTRTRPLRRTDRLPADAISRIRGSIILLGPLAAAWNRFTLAKPGGDKIGTRPITAHIQALADLGVRVHDVRGTLSVSVAPGARTGKRTAWLTEQSVTATEILLLYSSSLRRGDLCLYGAATEPHIVTLCRVLEAMGARIHGIGSNILTISWPSGVREPKRAIRLDDDFMEASTIAVAAAVTRSDVDIVYRNATDLALTNRIMGWMGVRTELGDDHWSIRGRSSRLALIPSFSTLKAEPWPRFHTDIMSVFVVLATQCTGPLKFIEYMYDDRFGFVQALRDMGAQIRTDGPHVIVVEGGRKLAGNEMLLRPDIRSGAAMLIAALAADGSSVLHDRRGVIARGYEDLPGMLNALGANIEEIGPLFS